VSGKPFGNAVAILVEAADGGGKLPRRRFGVELACRRLARRRVQGCKRLARRVAHPAAADDGDEQRRDGRASPRHLRPEPLRS